MVRYVKIKDKVHYPGIYGSGLRVTGSLKPLSSIKDDVFFFPLGDLHGGRVCTPHELDMSEYNNLNDLLQNVVAMWYGLNHSILCMEWPTKNIENFNQLGWTSNLFAYSQAVEKGRSSWVRYFENYKETPMNYGWPILPSFDTFFPLDAAIIAEEWNKDFKFNLSVPVTSKELEAKKMQTILKSKCLLANKVRKKILKDNRYYG